MMNHFRSRPATADVANVGSRPPLTKAKSHSNEGLAFNETLYDRAARMKHRWLSRVMYDGRASSSEKCLAYLVMDHLNCVTLDCWPGKRRIIERLGWESTRTADRAVKGLEALELLRVTRPGLIRYAPMFTPQDADKNDTKERQDCPRSTDKFGAESLLVIHPNQSTPTEEARQQFELRVGPERYYDRSRRGAHERELAQLIGPDGYDVLASLSDVDDTIIDRLCAAHVQGGVGAREIDAARLAVAQLAARRRLR
jgi:hypothetical protein